MCWPRLFVCSEKLLLSEVRPANVITLSGADELLNLITSHSEYELSGETSKDYDWPSIERQVILRYINNKPRITFSREQMAHYVYQEDFNLHNQIQTIDESQVCHTDVAIFYPLTFRNHNCSTDNVKLCTLASCSYLWSDTCNSCNLGMYVWYDFCLVGEINGQTAEIHQWLSS